MNHARANSARATIAAAAVLLLIGAKGAAPSQQSGNRFSPNSTTAKYERKRDYDLRNVLIRLKVDWEKKSFGGSARHMVAPLQDGMTELKFDAGPGITILKCLIGGSAAPFKHEGGS